MSGSNPPLDAEGVVLVLDVGTSSVKASARRSDGSTVAFATRPYPLSSPRPGWAEQSADDWWDEAMRAGRETMSAVNESVVALTVCNQQVTTVPLDADLTPLSPAILWMDTRTSTIAARLRPPLDDLVLSTVGMPISTSWAPLRLLWWAENTPEVMDQARWFATVDAYFYARLTGEMVTDHTNACFGPYDITHHRWSEDLIPRLGIDAAQLPRSVPSGTGVGELLPMAARALGVPPGTPVIAGASDQPSSAVGLGAVDQDTAAVTVGTGTFAVLPTTQPETDRRYMVSCSTVPDQWIRYGIHYLAGGLVEWLVQLVGGTAAEVGELAASAAPGADGVVLLPYFQGARTPHFDDAATGVLFGLQLGTDRATIARAIIESNGYGIRELLDVMSEPSPRDVEIRLAGGGADNPLTPQVVADITGRPVAIPEDTESTGLGAALLAWTALGTYPDVASAVDRGVSVKRTVEPDRRLAALYEERFDTYQQLYRRLQPLFSESQP